MAFVVVDPRVATGSPHDVAPDGRAVAFVARRAVEDARVAVKAVVDAPRVAVCLPARLSGGLTAVVAFVAQSA